MFRAFITIASNDLPTRRLPTLFSRLHACAPPGVRSQRKADIVSGLDANESVFDISSGEVIATTLAAIDAYWMAARDVGSKANLRKWQSEGSASGAAVEDRQVARRRCR